jgi:hypothetical protein
MWAIPAVGFAILGSFESSRASLQVRQPFSPEQLDEQQSTWAEGRMGLEADTKFLSKKIF